MVLPSPAVGEKASVEIDELGPVIGSHLGPRGVGICVSRESK